MPQDLSDEKSTMFQLMAWCHQATSHYLNQCWPSLMMMPFGVIRLQWVKKSCNILPLLLVEEIGKLFFSPKCTPETPCGHICICIWLYFCVHNVFCPATLLICMFFHWWLLILHNPSCRDGGYHICAPYLEPTGNVTLVDITGTTIMVQYLLSQFTATHLKIKHPLP